MSTKGGGAANWLGCPGNSLIRFLRGGIHDRNRDLEGKAGATKEY